PAGTHGGTYGGGSAIASAAACATIDALIEDKLVENAAISGPQLVTGLKRLQKAFPQIGDVRGKGLMVATEFGNDGGGHGAEISKRVLTACIKRRLLLLSCGTYQNVIRWIPPLVVNKDEIDLSLKLFEQALKEVLGNGG
ncbi:MAG: aminotransferase class III-fold pyridoxal phosphate-dependent enzyme, partial [Bacteroidota bacterium]